MAACNSCEWSYKRKSSLPFWYFRHWMIKNIHEHLTVPVAHNQPLSSVSNEFKEKSKETEALRKKWVSYINKDNTGVTSQAATHRRHKLVPEGQNSPGICHSLAHGVLMAIMPLVHYPIVYVGIFTKSHSFSYLSHPRTRWFCSSTIGFCLRIEKTRTSHKWPTKYKSRFLEHVFFLVGKDIIALFWRPVFDLLS